jgi:hypothetical protein
MDTEDRFRDIKERLTAEDPNCNLEILAFEYIYKLEKELAEIKKDGSQYCHYKNHREASNEIKKLKLKIIDLSRMNEMQNKS